MRIRQLSIFLMLTLILSPFSLPAQAHNETDIVNLVRDTRGSVVSVRGVSQSQQPDGNFPFDFFFPYSPDQFPRGAPRRQPREPEAASIGSGFIIDSEGYILTNAHVVRNLRKIAVTLSDGSEYPAEVIGADRLTDIAVLKIEPDAPLQAVQIGDSDELLVGQSVLAIGSPYGLDQTVTSGIISALGRRLPRENYVPFIQTDAAVNPGNSGGPLMDGEGRVIGINSQIISPVRAFAGVSFAIPINVAMDIQQRLRESGVVRRGYLGVAFRPVTDTDAEVFGLKEARGALIQEVIEGSAAAEAGILTGDILLSFNGVEVEESADLPLIVTSVAPGTEVEVEVLREGEVLTLTTSLGEIQSDDRPVKVLGMRLENLDEQRKRQAELEGGVVIAAIEPGKDTPPDVVRQLRAGDIITHVYINGRLHRVDKVAGLTKALSEMPSNSVVAFRVWREGRRLIITIKLGG